MRGAQEQEEQCNDTASKVVCKSRCDGIPCNGTIGHQSPSNRLDTSSLRHSWFSPTDKPILRPPISTSDLGWIMQDPHPAADLSKRGSAPPGWTARLVCSGEILFVYRSNFISTPAPPTETSKPLLVEYIATLTPC